MKYCIKTRGQVCGCLDRSFENAVYLKLSSVHASAIGSAIKQYLEERGYTFFIISGVNTDTRFCTKSQHTRERQREQQCREREELREHGLKSAAACKKISDAVRVVTEKKKREAANEFLDIEDAL